MSGFLSAFSPASLVSAIRFLAQGVIYNASKSPLNPSSRLGHRGGQPNTNHKFNKIKAQIRATIKSIEKNKADKVIQNNIATLKALITVTVCIKYRSDTGRQKKLYKEYNPQEIPTRGSKITDSKGHVIPQNDIMDIYSLLPRITEGLANGVSEIKQTYHSDPPDSVIEQLNKLLQVIAPSKKSTEDLIAESMLYASLHPNK